MPTRSIGSGSWPAARAISAGARGAGARRTRGLGALHGQARAPGRATVVPRRPRGRQQGGSQGGCAQEVVWTWKTPMTNGNGGWRADAPHQHRSVDGAGQTRSLSVDRKSGSGGGRACGGGRRRDGATASMAASTSGSSSTCTSAGCAAAGSLTDLEGLAPGRCECWWHSTGWAWSMPSHGHAGVHHRGHRLGVGLHRADVARQRQLREQQRDHHQARWSSGGAVRGATCGSV